jgi:hypothetical protein
MIWIGSTKGKDETIESRTFKQAILNLQSRIRPRMFCFPFYQEKQQFHLE